jgi:hypothetical protein
MFSYLKIKKPPYFLSSLLPLRPLTTVAFFDHRSFSVGGGEGGLRRYFCFIFASMLNVA